MGNGTTCNLRHVKRSKGQGKFAEHARGLRFSGWSYGNEYGTDELHSSPDDPTPYSVKTRTPNAFISAKPSPPPSHDDARRTPYPPWNDYVSTEPHNVKFCRSQCGRTGYGYSCPIVYKGTQGKRKHTQKLLEDFLNFDQMLTLNMKIPDSCDYFLLLPLFFFIKQQRTNAARTQCELTGSLRQFCPCKDPLEKKKKKDSESYNYCSINIGTKLNLYISVDHSVMLPQIVLEEKKKIYPCFPHYVCCSQKNDCLGSSVNSLSRRDCGIF